MTNFESLAERVFSLYSIAPEGAGLTIKFPWAHIYVDQGKFGRSGYEGRFEVITDIPLLTTIPPTTKIVASFEAATLDEARARFIDCAKSHGCFTWMPEAVIYRNDRFAERTFEDERRPREGFSLVSWMAGRADRELISFVGEVTERACAFASGVSSPEGISLWFYADGGYDAAYVDVRIRERWFEVTIKDRIVWPWKEKRLSVNSLDARKLGGAISAYMSRNHAFRFKSLRVYFAHLQKNGA